uniref:Xylulose kinase-1 n=1 Tax=Tanacetum cinerariifolium TaxID=118510 RepID=A0A699HBK8_TANCI|nr:hypothetical protein [Tanacetum cinerariifolium]
MRSNTLHLKLIQSDDRKDGRCFMEKFAVKIGNSSLNTASMIYYCWAKVTKISQSSGPTNLVADKTVYKEWEDRMERAATTASSLKAKQDSEKPSESEGFEQIINFLNAKPIRYALTVNPIVYASCVKQFWTTTKVKKVNGQEQIQALVDKQKIIITKESIRCDLKFDDAEGTACLPNDTIFAELARMGNVTPLFKTMMVHAQKEVGEGLGLHTNSYHTPIDTQPSLSKSQKKIKPKRNQRQAAEVHSPSSEIPVEESIPTPSNDPLPSGEDSIQLNELMIFCTNLQQHVLDLEEAKIAQAKEIAKLKKRVKKLEKKRKSRPAGLKRLKKVGGRSIKDIDQDAEIALVDESQGRMHDADMFEVDDLEVTTASVEDSVAPTTATTVDVDDELTLAKTLIAIKAAKPKVISTAITTQRAKVDASYVQLVLLVNKVTPVFNKVNAAKSRVTTAVRVSTTGWKKWLEEQDMRVNEIY